MELPIFVFNKQIIEDVTMGADITSEVVDISEVIGFAVHCIWSGSPTGDIIVQGSNDGTNFISVSTQGTAGAAGQYLLNVERQHYRYMRIFYDRTSGTGFLSVYASAKRG